MSDFADDAAFRHAVDDVLHSLAEQLDGIEDDEVDDIRFSAGNLAIEFGSGATFVLSQQTPTFELWLSANLRAWHFHRQGGRWIERDSGQPMAEVLGDLISEKLGASVGIQV